MNEPNDQDAEAEDVTRLLHGSSEQRDKLYALVYDQLKAIARNRLRAENREKSFQTTALVNEAYLRLAKQENPWRDRRHFYGVAAEAMRRILIDAARNRKRAKRGGDAISFELSEISLPAGEWEADILELHQALQDLEQESPENAEIVQLRFFSGLTCEECSQVLEISLSTVERRWRFAKAWLRTRMQEQA
jgi:RNA polymerase sigma-70 factor, ECF subfamily